MDSKRVLLKDIAKRANLTVNTVSRALKNKSDISVQTRQYVQELALEMGYIPDVVASSLRNGFTKTIGVMFDNISNPYYMIMTEYLNEYLKQAGYDIMIFTSSGLNAQFDNEILNKMVSRRIDGIITFLRPTKEVARFVIKNKIPLVVVGREADDIGIDSVYTDDFNGGYLVAEHLTKKGHHKIGYLGAPKDIMCSKKRAEGLEKYMIEHGIPYQNDQILFLEHGDMSLDNPTKQLVDLGLTAIFCFNDTMAYEVMNKLHDYNKNVPEDILVIGYDNIEDFLRVPVGLTSVSADKKELAKEAVKILLDRINNPGIELQRIVKDTKLILRKTA